MQPALGSREEKRAFYKMTFRITLPIALQNLMDACVNSADVVMLALVGQNELSASSLAGQVAFVLNMLLFGIASGASVLAAQYWGKGDRRTIERVMAISLRLSVAIGLLFTFAAAFVPGSIMRIFTNKPELIEAGSKYLVALSPSYVLSAFATLYLAVMRSVERVNMSAIVHGTAVLMNVALNACFIFGWGPFPKLGIVGVALATTITRACEALYCLLDTTVICKTVKLRVKDFFARHAALMKDFMRYSVPAAANDIVWGLAFSVYSAILGRLSSDIVAANSVAGVVRNLATVVCFGTSSAAAIILGKSMGAGKIEESRLYGRRFFFLSFATAVVGGLVIIACRAPVLNVMHYLLTQQVTDRTREYVGLMLWINSYYIIGQSVNTMLVCGVFRAGGDVKFGLVADLCAMWIYAVPVGLICAFVLKLPEMWVYFVLCLDEFVKMPLFIHHYRSNRWAANITRTDM